MAETLPPAPDYADASQWFAARHGGETDLFYVIATETADRTLPDGTVSHHTDPRDPAQRKPMRLEMQGVDDTGGTVCGNSVRNPTCSMWPRSAVAINPANWRTDAAPAAFATEPSPFIPLDRQRKGPLVASLDPASNLVLVSGYTADDYLIPAIGREGCYHSREIWLYRDSIRENMALRARRHARLSGIRP